VLDLPDSVIAVAFILVGAVLLAWSILSEKEEPYDD
jgi:hypothetical protein